MRDDSLARQAVDCFGAKNQMVKTAEEASELSAAMLKAVLTEDPEKIQEAIDEAADVSIMLDQVKEIFGASRLSEAKARKEKKLLAAIEARRGSEYIRQFA